MSNGSNSEPYSHYERLFRSLDVTVSVVAVVVVVVVIFFPMCLSRNFVSILRREESERERQLLIDIPRGARVTIIMCL